MIDSQQILVNLWQPWRTGAWKESWFSSFCSFDVMLYQEAKPNAFDEETIENQVHLQEGTSWTGSAEVSCWNHHQEGSNQSPLDLSGVT